MLLIVEDDPIALRTLQRLVGDRPTVHAGSALEARAVLDSRSDITGCLVDVALPEGPRAGLEVLGWIRDKHQFVPCALVTGSTDAEVLDAAVLLRATIVRKPAVGARLELLLERMDRYAPDESKRAILRAATDKYAFTPRESEIVAWFLSGQDQSSFLAHSGISRSTFKEHRKNILRKTRDESLERLASRLLQAEIQRRS
jgi:DNA-binding NarL/FixJ family response regulator